MSWVEILKGPKWDNMIQQILNDEFQHKINHEKIKNLLSSIKKGFT